MVIAVFLDEEEEAKSRSVFLSLSTTRSNSRTYIMLDAAREGMTQVNPFPARMEWTALRQSFFISFCTIWGGIAVTSLHTPEIPASLRVRLCLEEDSFLLRASRWVSGGGMAGDERLERIPES